MPAPAHEGLDTQGVSLHYSLQLPSDHHSVYFFTELLCGSLMLRLGWFPFIAVLLQLKISIAMPFTVEVVAFGEEMGVVNLIHIVIRRLAFVLDN